MKRKYVRHEPDYAIGENEALYAAMARRGWHLDKRGQHFSRFRQGESAPTEYRIELAAPDWLEETALPDEQLAFYEECGWRLAARHGLVHVFAAPAGSGTPELYSDPRQQAGTLRALRRQYRSGWIAVAIILAVTLLLSAAMRGSLGQTLGELLGSVRLAFVTQTAAMLAYAAFVLAAVLENIHGSICTMRLYRRLKRGEAIDRAPHRRVFRRINDALCVITAIFLALMLAQYVTRTSAPLPEAADGAYLLLEDFGLTGEREAVYGKASTLKTDRSLAARHYDIYECLRLDDGQDVWIFEDVYELAHPALAETTARALMEDATFAHADEFVEFAVDGLDRAWHGPGCYIAIRGARVCSMTYSGLSRGDGTWGAYDPAVFSALAQRWAE